MEEGGGSSQGGSNPISENLKKALDDLRGAGEKATGDVRSRIDSAVQALNEASSQVATRAQDGVSKATGQASDQLGGFRETLDKTTEDVRVQLAKLAVKAQTSVESISAIEEELKKRRAELE